jgi:hypothetical protein
MKRRHALVVKWHLATDQNIQDDAKAPHINLGTGVGSGLQKLRRGKVQATAKGLEMATWGEEVAQAKINDLDIAGLADEYVLDLEVAVDDAVPMTVVKGTRDLTAKLPGLLLLELAMGNDIIEHLAAVDIFE